MPLDKELGSRIIDEAAEMVKLKPSYERARYEAYYQDLKQVLEQQEQKPYMQNTDKEIKARNLALGTVFQLSVINSIVVSETINENIDKYFDSYKNAHLFEGYSKKEIKEFRQSLKDSVTERLAVKPRTTEGQKLADDLKESYLQHIKSEGNTKTTFEISAMTPVISAIIALRSNQEPNLSGSQLDEDPQHIPGKIVADSMAENAEVLAREEDILFKYINNVIIPYDEKNLITEDAFLTRFRDDNLTAEDKEWAERLFDRQISGPKHKNIDFSTFEVDGKPLFSKEQLETTPKQELKTAVIGSALHGQKVAYKDGNLFTMVNVSIGAKKNYSVWDRIIDFFKGLLGIGSMEKDINAKAAENKSDFAKMTTSPLRQKVTIDELSGAAGLKKVMTPEKRADFEKKNHGIDM